jgi:SAM-dependent methyltransferase
MCGVGCGIESWRCGACGSAPEEADHIVLLAPRLAGGNPDDAEYGYDDLMAAEAHHFWFEARSRLIVQAMRKTLPGARSFLDLGCGAGGVLEAIARDWPSLRLTAADAHLAGLRLARLRVPGASFVQLDVNRLPYDSEFDMIGAFDVLEHLDDDGLVLRQMHRATVPGGGIVITVPQHPWLWSAMDDFSRHRRRYTRSELSRQVRDAGFAVERVTSFMSLVLPAMVWSRMATRDVAPFDRKRELTLGAAANAICGSFCRIETTTIAWGCSWPFGGSLLLVARRPS